MKSNLKIYSDLLNEIKIRVKQGQLRANLSANTEMLAAYWDIGRIIQQRQAFEGWGKGVIPRLADDLKNEFSEMKGFSERNLKYMVQFYNEYAKISIGQPVVAQIPNTNKSIVQLAVAQLTEPENSNVKLPEPNFTNLSIYWRIFDFQIKPEFSIFGKNWI